MEADPAPEIIKPEKGDAKDTSSLYIPERKAHSEERRRREESVRREPEYSGRNTGRYILWALIALVLVAGGIWLYRSHAAKKAAEAESASIEASIEASIAESEALEALKPKAQAVTRTDIPELAMLVQEYFDARMNADSTRIFEIFGRKDTAADPEFEKKLKAQASWIQGFQDIEVYDAPGAEKDERFCIVRYIIDFRRTDTLAPGIMYFYAKQQPEGEYTLMENLMKDKMDYVQAELEDPSVSSMIQDTDSRLKEALDRDSTLALIYTSFRNGEIYKESRLEVDKEQEVDLFLDPEDSILIDKELYQGLGIGQTPGAEEEAAAEDEVAAEEETAVEAETAAEEETTE